MNKISAGSSYSAAIASGTPWIWGIIVVRNLGLGGVETNLPSEIPDLTSITTVSLGQLHSLFVGCDGNVWVTGWNDFGQLGTGGYEECPKVHQISLSNIFFAATKNNHSIFINNDLEVWVCGWNAFGQLGLGHTELQPIPIQIDLPNIVSVDAGYTHSIFIGADGSVWGCGRNSNGQLGLGDQEPRQSPTKIVSLPQIKTADAGFDHTVFIDMNGGAWSCGKHLLGQLGLGKPLTHTHFPKKVDFCQLGASNVILTAVSCGYEHTVFLDEEGIAWSCGNNKSLQLGFGENISSLYRPNNLENLPPILAIACGKAHSLFLDSDGAVWSCGNNSHAQLGALPGAAKTLGKIKLPPIMLDKKVNVKSARKIG